MLLMGGSDVRSSDLPVLPRFLMIVFLPHLYTLQASVSNPMKMTNSKRHDWMQNIASRFKQGSNQGHSGMYNSGNRWQDVASRFLIAKKRGLNQNWPQCFGVSKFQVQSKGWHCGQAKARAVLGFNVIIFKCWESWSQEMFPMALEPCNYITSQRFDLHQTHQKTKPCSFMTSIMKNAHGVYSNK